MKKRFSASAKLKVIERIIVFRKQKYRELKRSGGKAMSPRAKRDIDILISVASDYRK